MELQLLPDRPAGAGIPLPDLDTDPKTHPLGTVAILAQGTHRGDALCAALFILDATLLYLHRGIPDIWSILLYLHRGIPDMLFRGPEAGVPRYRGNFLDTLGSASEAGWGLKVSWKCLQYLGIAFWRVLFHHDGTEQAVVQPLCQPCSSGGTQKLVPPLF